KIKDVKKLLLQKIIEDENNIDLVYRAVYKSKKIANENGFGKKLNTIKKQIITSLVQKDGENALDSMVDLNDYEGINFAFGNTRFKRKTPREILSHYPELAVYIMRSKNIEETEYLSQIKNQNIRFEEGVYLYHTHNIQNACQVNKKDIEKCKKKNLEINRGYQVTKVDRGTGSIKLDGLLGWFKPKDFTHYHVPRKK
ncbi:hypothetical protein HOD20_09685, partial [archaeon]|nr:hypothetical protein [archaeon]